MHHFFKYLIILSAFLMPIIHFAQKQNENNRIGNEKLFPSKMSPEEIITEGQQKLKGNLSEKNRYEVMLKISSSYLKIKKPDFEKATQMLFEAKSFAEEKNNILLKAKIYGTIANHYSYLNFPEKVKPYLDLSKEQINQLSESSEKNFLNALLNIEYGNLEADKENFEGAKKYYQKSLKQLQKNGNRDKKEIYQYRRIFYNLGVSYTYLKLNDSAEFYLNKALKIPDEERKDFKYFIYNSLGKVYINKKEYKKAIDTLNKVLRDDQFHDNRLKEDIYKKLVSSYKMMNDDANYKLYTEKLLELNPDVRENNLKAINTAVNAEQEHLLKTISQKESKNKLLTIISIIIVFTSGFYLFFIIKKRKKEKLIYEKFVRDLKTREEVSEKQLVHLQEENLEKEKISAINIPVQVEESILLKLKKFEESAKFANPKLTVATMAVLFKTNPTYLSETIKKNKGKNFNTYINELRINYICKQINARPEYLNYKISYLAEQAGFSSHSSFTTVFKNVTGISPSSFLREAEHRIDIS